MKIIDTDTREIECNLSHGGMLVVGESYSAGWRAKPIAPPPAGQGEYRVMPANWAFIGVPLAVGKHHFTLEFRPAGYVMGGWITAIAFTAMAATGFNLLRLKRIKTNG
jgi:uncharacterized membrane protein YfhO